MAPEVSELINILIAKENKIAHERLLNFYKKHLLEKNKTFIKYFLNHPYSNPKKDLKYAIANWIFEEAMERNDQECKDLIRDLTGF